jgi:NitT/TauT family transport system substrate-binding protein
LALTAASCDSGKPEAEEAPVIRYVNFKVYDPVYVAVDEGFFEKEGCKVEIVGDVIAGPNAIQAVAAGSAEAGLSSIPAIINANAAGLPIQGVVDIQTTLPSQALQRWYVHADSDIQTLEDVVGRTYAVNIWRSSFHYTSLLAMDQRNIDPDTVDFLLLSFADQIPALIEREVDVIGLIQPYQAYLEDEFGDQVRELYNDYDDVYGTRHVSLIFINRLWAQYNPDQAVCFTTGVSKAIDWIEENQDAARKIVSKYTGIPEASVRDYHFTPHGQVRLQDVQTWLDYLIERGDVADWVDLDMVASDKYNENK